MSITNPRPSLAPKTGYGCPVCGTPHHPSTGRYRNHVCGTCIAQAADSGGRLLDLLVHEPSRTFEARYRDGDLAGRTAPDVTGLRTCFIDKHPFHVAVDAYGRVVLIPINEYLERRRDL